MAKNTLANWLPSQNDVLAKTHWWIDFWSSCSSVNSFLFWHLSTQSPLKVSSHWEDHLDQAMVRLVCNISKLTLLIYTFFTHSIPRTFNWSHDRIICMAKLWKVFPPPMFHAIQYVLQASYVVDTLLWCYLISWWNKMCHWASQKSAYVSHACK